jgi:glycosyltransferase involved in cell wall biosynthesis
VKICLFNVTSTIDQIGSTEVGGVEAYTFRLGAALQERGHEVTLIGGKPKSGRSYFKSKLNVKLAPYVETKNIPKLGTRFRRLVQRLHFAGAARSVFRNTKFDAIFIFKPYDFTTAWRWRRQGVQSRIIASIHGPEFYSTDRFFVRSIDAMFAVSHSTSRSVERHYDRKCEVIPNFLDLENFPLLQRPNPPESKLIIALGRLVGWKGMASLINAFSIVHQKHKDTHLAIIGGGPEKESLVALARRRGVQSAVSFPGILDEAAVLQYHQRASLFVQPSIGYESFSISSLEALASGLTVIASDQVSLAQWFKDGGIEVYPAGDEEKLAEKMDALLTEPWEANRQRGLKAREIVEAEFSAARVVSKIERLCSS